MGTTLHRLGPETFRLASSKPLLAYVRMSESARLGTKNDARNRGRMLFPVHRNATISSSAAPKVSIRLEFRPFRTCSV
jgi:hypothetical protein